MGEFNLVAVIKKKGDGICVSPLAFHLPSISLSPRNLKFRNNHARLKFPSVRTNCFSRDEVTESVTQIPAENPPAR